MKTADVRSFAGIRDRHCWACIKVSQFALKEALINSFPCFSDNNIRFSNDNDFGSEAKLDLRKQSSMVDDV